MQDKRTGTHRLHVKLPLELWEDLQAEIGEDVTASSFVRQAIVEKLYRDKEARYRREYRRSQKK